MVKVSVIVPVYNAEKYLAECLDCLINQTLSDIEIICINDGSSDKSIDILESYAKKDNRIKVINKDNQGAGAARNVGLDNAVGEYIYFLDADDFIELDTLEKTYNSSDEKDLDVLIFQLINYDGEKDEYYNSNYYEMAKLAEFVGEDVFNYKDIGDLIFNVAVSPVNKLYKRALIDKFNVRFPEGMIFEDNIFFWNVFLNAKRILFVKKHYYIRRVHSSSVMGSASIKFIDTIKIHNMITEIFKEHNIFDKFKSKLFDKKVRVVYKRFTQVGDENKPVFYREMKSDFQNMADEYGLEEILSCLTDLNKITFNNIVNSRTCEELILLMSTFNYEKDNKKLRSRNKRLKKEVENLKKENSSLLNSTSWKLTKPIRFFKNLLSR